MLIEKPEAIIITYPLQLVKDTGYKDLLNAMLAMNDHGGAWYQKCRNKPKHDVMYVYITIGGMIRLRTQYVGWDKEVRIPLYRPDGSLYHAVGPHMILTGPVLQAPGKIPYKGFRGFRYTIKYF